MAFQSERIRVVSAGNGATTNFSYPWKFLDATDLDVYLVDSDGEEEFQDFVADYDVVGNYNSGTGEYDDFSEGASVNFVVAPASGFEVVILRNTPDTQDTSLTQNSSYSSLVIETALDKIVMMVQYLKDRSDRSLRLTEASTQTFDLTMPNPLEADCVLAVNSDGDGFVMGPTVDQVEEAEDAAEDAIAAAAAAAISAASASSSASSASTSASSASTSASSASTSATNASNSASSASTSATTASNAATSASTSASNAATSETNAANSASSASTSATNASNSASSASTSATNANNSAIAAAASQVAAASYFGSGNIAETTFTIANNQSSPADVTGLLFSTSTVRSAEIDIQVYRNTTSGGATELSARAKYLATYKTVAASWDLSPQGVGGDVDASTGMPGGVTLTITTGGQVRYTSTNITGTAASSVMHFRATTMGV